MGMTISTRSGQKRKIRKVQSYLQTGDVANLMGMIQDRDPRIVTESLKALGTIAHNGGVGKLAINKAVERITPLMAHTDRYVRLYASRALCWISVKGSPTDLVTAGSVSYVVSLLSDDEPDTRRYCLAILGELVDRNLANSISNVDGLGPIGGLVVNKDLYTSHLAIKLLGKMGEQGYGASIIMSGSCRMLFLASNMADKEGRELAVSSLKKISTSMGFSDLTVFKEHLKDVEKDTGRKLDEDYTPSISMDAYFSGGATGVSTSSSGHHDGKAEVGSEYEQPPQPEPEPYYDPGTEAMDDDGDFEVDELDVIIEDEFEVDADIESESMRQFPFNILIDRLREIKHLADKKVINGNDYYHLKSKILQDIEISVKLDCLNCYDALEIDPSAGPVEIKQAYRRLAAQYHPDKVENLGPKLRAIAMEEMTKINYAKEVLLDPVKKEEHDKMVSSAWSY